MFDWVKYFYIVFNLLTLVATIMFLIWGGIKGMLGIVFGIFYMALAIKQKSPMLMFIVNRYYSQWYLDRLEGKREKDES